jgi:hypothetical protein
MLLNNGVIINNAPDISEKTRQHLNQFWSFPSKEEVDKEKEKYYVNDCRRAIHRITNSTENITEP